MKIENTREIFFTSKEQYIHFRKVWSEAVNSEKAKKTVTNSKYGSHRKQGWLSGAHHLIYNLLRGKDGTNGFTPTTSTNKLSNGGIINHGLYEARKELAYIAKSARKYIQNTESGKVSSSTAYSMGVVGDFLKPFDGCVTPQMIIKIDDLCPQVEVLESSYGRGRILARVIIEAEVKPTTFADMWKIYEDAGNILEEAA